MSRGFTLIELLVVIAIIAVLAGTLAPVIGMVRASGRQTACAAVQRQIHMACTLYANDQDGQLPDICLAGNGYWQILIKDYLEQQQETYLGTTVARGNIFQACPELDRSATGCGFALNSKLAYGAGGQRDLAHNRWIQGGTWTTFTLPGIQRPAQRLYLQDAPAAASAGEAMLNYINIDADTATLERSMRHRSRVAGVFIDGHAAGLDATRLQAALAARD